MKKIYFYNTLTQTKEELIPSHGSTVNIYTCGPTIYDYAHIGNFRSYIFGDLLVRTLQILGYSPYQVMNLTDVDDKTIKGALTLYSEATVDNLKKYTEKYQISFFEDLKKLKITPAKQYPKATDHIDDMIDLTEILLKKKIAYEKEGSIYFSIKDFSDYGQLSKLDANNIKSGTRYNTDEYSKEDIRDFVLWKNRNDHKDISWSTKLGEGRPGWHLECSAMIHSIFKSGIDIHTGGIDLVFPHHENEIAQSKCAYGDDFVKYWLHCEHLLVDGKKMSKSLGNFYTLRTLLDQGYHSTYIRYFLLSVHYRQKLNFTLEALEQIKQTIHKIWNTYNRFIATQEDNITEEALDDSILNFKEQFNAALSDDLNISKALSVFHSFLNFINQLLDSHRKLYNKDILFPSHKQKLQECFSYFDSVLDILSESNSIVTNIIPENVQSLFLERLEARKNKNFLESDRLRSLIEQAGYTVKDDKNGSVLSLK